MAKFMYGTLWYLQTLHVNVGEGKIMVLNTTFNNMSAISWQSVLFVGETGDIQRIPPTCRKSMTNFIT
jgi:hypothetical protein